ncbi:MULTISPECIES: alpha-galactosidase [unclassified Facklamia]|uniref:alpha-galactosidase n=1 Tax=Aerococcaceae TaxID=186827 RepID=UPI0013B8D617|nr:MULTISPECIES: alpha-galactosidase [unclassified Facklamia]NEW63830.1 family 10 glycosylhydrolase [Facklamia sp. 252]NEW67301.1 family 10 glycosylhydrolase [Facklamia sp. 253]QQD65181.1 alpha-galactosidase [Aerococcaceae bacterium zg-252]
MVIIVNDTLFYLHGKSVSMILENRDGIVTLKHFGRKITNYHFSNQLHERDHAFSGNRDPLNRTYSYDTQRHIVGQHGLGDFRQPSIRIQHQQNEWTDLKLVDYKVMKGHEQADKLPNPHGLEEAETLQLIFKDELAGIRYELFYTVSDEVDTITQFVRVTNESKQPIVLHRVLSTMLDVPAKPYDVVTLQGSYGREKTVRRQSVTQGIFSIESNRGASGHAQTPALILCDQRATDNQGEAIALQLMYSGNFQAFVQQNQLNEIRLGIGINDDNFSWELAPQTSFDSPVALLSYSANGLQGLTSESQSYIKQHIIPAAFSDKERPILINNWEATYFNFNKEKLLEIVDEAAALGMELFVLDDGWFGNRFDDNRALGDWYVNETKLGGSLAELIKEVHQRGLQFGLWIEPEMISQESDLYQEHPEWVIQVPGREHTYSRNQLVLDYSNPEVVQYMKKLFDDLLSTHEIDYIKWDMNRNMTNIGNGDSYLATRAQSHRYMLGVYELAAHLTENHPTVLFESCSGGGGRNDLGMMRYFPQVWASDNTDAICRLDIQYGSNFLYPTISMGSHVSAVPNHQVNRLTSIQTRGDVAMMGNLGYELDLTQLSDEEKAIVKEQVERYKTIRSTVQNGKFYRLINPDELRNEVAVQYSDEEQTVVTYVRILSTIETIESTLYLKGLEEDTVYELAETGLCYSGAELMYAGLTMVLPAGDFLSQQLVFKRIV